MDRFGERLHGRRHRQADLEAKKFLKVDRDFLLMEAEQTQVINK